MVDVGLVARGTEKAPLVDDVQLRALADAHRAGMRPARPVLRIECGVDAHQLLPARDTSDTCSDGLIDRARRAPVFREARDTQQDMAQAIALREAQERVGRLAPGC